MFATALSSLRAHWADLTAEIDRHTTVVLIAVPALLAWLHFCGSIPTFRQWFVSSHWTFSDLLHAWEWWGFNCVLTMFLVPALLVRYAFKQSLQDYGLSVPNLKRQFPLALAMYLIVLPFIIGASRAPAFRQMYPLFTEAGSSASTLLIWEGIYLAQFFSLEFFFRGFIVFGLSRRFGSAAILVSTVPYCMIHFQKPMPEAYGAIVAGLVLGSVALRTRSLWSGFMTHAMVALTMDALALHARGVI